MREWKVDLLLLGFTQRSRSVNGNGLLIYSIAMTKVFAESRQL